MFGYPKASPNFVTGLVHREHGYCARCCSYIRNNLDEGVVFCWCIRCRI